MKFYKMRHIPSGWFYKPSEPSTKVNMSKKGKVYNQKPLLKWIGDVRFPPENMKGKLWGKHDVKILPFIESEWEIVEYKVEENGNI